MNESSIFLAAAFLLGLAIGLNVAVLWLIKPPKGGPRC